ncbi:LamG-like jellyroll fold domain-containing protein [Methanohalophilus sp.]|uniref:LamG-like jellyroll fold domain-containing protein n=1 Tax=Methanohalophilus sp. TaxID=1966352 RepID=UPI0026195B31|nr:LamG-like jellyroll fold domain-containing protein [Methanohalophilus sp.]MDK2891929.1 hypothetical protein [Methanohalophilus sp.]
MPVIPRRNKLLSNDSAVAEVVGEILLTAIVVLAFASIVTFVFSQLGPAESARVDVDAWADTESDTLYFRHAGGETVDINELELLVNINGTTKRIDSDTISSFYHRDMWEFGDIIALNVSDMFGYNINENSYLQSKMIHTSANLVFFDSQLYGGDTYYSGSSGNLQAPVLTDPYPPNLSCTSSVLEPATFKATSSQASYNEFLLNGVRVAWSNGTFPIYTNTPLSAGTHTLTLVAHNTIDPSLTDSITWEWTVTGMPGIYADRLILNKNDIGGVIKDGGYISFTNEGNYRYVTIDGTQYDLNPGDSIKLEIVNDQTSGQIDMNIESAQISTFDFNVNLYINGVLVDSGYVTDLYVQPISDFISTLRYELPSYESGTYLKANNDVIIGWWPTNDSAINIYNIGFYSSGSTLLTFNPSDTYLKCSGYYEILPASSSSLTSPVSLWTFNSSNADDSIDDNDGSTVRQVEWGTGVGGTTGLMLDGLDEYVTVPDSSNLDLSDEGSIVAWIYMDEFIPYAGIVHKGQLKDYSDEAYFLKMWETPKVYFGINQLTVSSSTTLNEGQWYHLVGTWNSSSVNLYIDGELDTSTINQWGISAPKTSGSLQIGAQITENIGLGMKNFGFDGSIDEVAIYDYALNATEVELLYNQY